MQAIGTYGCWQRSEAVGKQGKVLSMAGGNDSPEDVSQPLYGSTRVDPNLTRAKSRSQKGVACGQKESDVLRGEIIDAESDSLEGGDP